MLAAADRGDHVDARALVEPGVEPRALAVDVHMNVRTQSRPLLAEPVAQPRPLGVEAVDRLRDRCRLDVELPWQLPEEWLQCRREVQLGHRYARTATSTDEIDGR